MNSKIFTDRELDRLKLFAISAGIFATVLFSPATLLSNVASCLINLMFLMVIFSLFWILTLSSDKQILIKNKIREIMSYALMPLKRKLIAYITDDDPRSNDDSDTGVVSTNDIDNATDSLIQSDGNSVKQELIELKTIFAEQ